MKSNAKGSVVFKEYVEESGQNDLVNVFARVPPDIHEKAMRIKKNEGWSVYKLVKVAFELLVSEYEKRGGQLK